ncbi:MAG: class I SAM-dependent methyltransferase [Proteobacteria bacterium]|nr:class I SAM-dependent methyltransferase [Pseudomonadota bacterium]
MNDLQAFFEANDGRLIHKWMHYFEVYDRHFARFRGTDVHVLEFGVSQGGSLDMWRDYFGPRCRIFGADINPHCKTLENEHARIFIGDQEDRGFLRSLAQQIPRVDILIDDGGHTMRQQIATFEELFGHVSPNGVYLCEDIHTSYWKRWGGGHRRRGSFVEYAKGFIDRIHAWHSESPTLAVDDFTRSAHSLHWYDSILVIEKRPMTAPEHRKTGAASIPDYQPPSWRASTRLTSRLRRAIGMDEPAR